MKRMTVLQISFPICNGTNRCQYLIIFKKISGFYRQSCIISLLKCDALTETEAQFLENYASLILENDLVSMSHKKVFAFISTVSTTHILLLLLMNG